VWVDEGETGAHPPEHGPDYRDELIATLREQLRQANERDRENRRIIAGLVQRVPEIESTETPGGPETAAGEPGEGDPDRGEGPQEATEHRSWWRRFFGFE
jgi:hypothetical protein